jgi:hypothetical protein
MISAFSRIPKVYNLLCIGLAAVYSLITAANNTRSIVIFPLTNYSGFIHKLKDQLSTLGYESISCHEFEMKFMHPHKFSYYASDIIVKLSYDSATIIGPKKAINNLNLNTEFKIR